MQVQGYVMKRSNGNGSPAICICVILRKKDSSKTNESIELHEV
jgi:hypothetical protein